MLDESKIIDALSALGAENIRGRGDRVICSCLLAPWTHRNGRDSKPSMVVFVHGRHGDPIFKCLGCGESGSLENLALSLAVLRKRIPWRAIDILWESESKSKEDQKASSPAKENKKSAIRKKIESSTYRSSFASAVGHYDFSLSPTDKLSEIPFGRIEKFLIRKPEDIPSYLHRRGISFGSVKDWSLGFDASNQQVLIPVFDKDRRLVAISRRKTVDGCIGCGAVDSRPGRPCDRCGRFVPPKYMHSKGFKKSLVLFGEDKAVPGDRVYVVEGQFDAIAMWQHGYRPVVATLGAIPSQYQMDSLRRRWEFVVCVTDGDDAGRGMASVIQRMIGDDVVVTARNLPDGQDPASMLLNRKDEFVNIVGRV